MNSASERLTTALADRYRLERELGAGGMATVYLAEDLKHHRKVAVKVLRPELAAVIGADRFLVEIRTTANLQHPHILPLHDSGEADSFLYYVMPYVEGESLRDRLNRETQLPVADAVRIATEVASALDYAHRHGVIHRDIKPENILLHDGSALVADFGIALAASKAGGTRMTETGMSLGTPHYMSPEQAMGEREITARSDVYALGAVTYEMLVGEPPFTGPSAQAIVAKVVTEVPRPLQPKRHTIPPQVEEAVLTALEKTPADRWASAAEFSRVLNGGTTERPYPRKTTGATTVLPSYRLTASRIATMAAVGALLFAAGYFLSHRRSTSTVGYDIGLPDSALVAFTKQNSLGIPAMSVAPSGQFVVYVADRGSDTELWYRSLRGFEARPIPGTEGAFGPFISPDGEWVAFFTNDGLLKKAPVGGGTVAPLAQVNLAKGGVWLSDRMLISEGARLVSVDPSSGAKSTNGAQCDFPATTPDHLLVWCGRAGSIWAVHPDDTLGTRLRFPRLAGSADTAPRYPTLFGSDARLIDGKYLLFMSIEGSLQAARFDPATMQLGRTVTVLDGVRREGYSGMGQYVITRAGDLVYSPGENAEVGRMVRTPDGVRFDTLAVPPIAAQRFDLSPDGRSLAVVVPGVRGEELRVYDLQTGRATNWQTGWYIGELRWDPSGTRIIYDVTRGPTDSSVTLIGAPNSSAPPDTVLRGAVEPSQFLANGTVLGSTGNTDMVTVHLGTFPARVDTLKLPEDQYYPSVSPNGQWMAFFERNRDVMLAPYPWRGVRYTVGSGLEPMWTKEGDLVYWARDMWWYKVHLTPGSNPPVQPPRRWFNDPQFMNTFYRSHFHTLDGQEIYLRGSGRNTGSYLRVIPGWVTLMERAVDGAK